MLRLCARTMLGLPRLVVRGRKRLSLRIRMVLLAVAAVLLTAVPCVLLAAFSLHQSGREAGRAAFTATVRLVEERLDAGYLNMLHGEVRDIRAAKQGLREKMDMLLSLRRALAARGNTHSTGTALEESLRAAGYLFAVYEQGRFALGHPALRQVAAEGSADSKGDALALRLRAAELPEEGVFSVFPVDGLAADGTFSTFNTDGLVREGASSEFSTDSLVTEGVSDTDKLAAEGTFSADGRERKTLLAYFRALPEGKGVACLAEPLLAASPQAAAWKTHLIENMRQRLTVSRYGGCRSVGIFTEEGEQLCASGDASSLRLAHMADAALREAREHGVAEYVAAASAAAGDAGGDMLYHIGYFKALDWFVIAEVPLSLLDARAVRLASHVALIVGIVSLCCLGLASLAALRLTNPLKLLTRKVEALGVADFSTSEKMRLFSPAERQALLPREDEIGRLARAFLLMAVLMRRNIRRLLGMTAAKERMQGELSAARDIQQGMLPAVPPSFPQLRTACTLTPAREVGGDLYDCFSVPDGRVAIIMGDVSGKGVPAALFMAMTLTLARSAFDEGCSPAVVLARVNERLCTHNAGNLFVTLFAALYDSASGELMYANAGHCPPLIAGRGGGRSLEGLSGPMAGMFSGLVYQEFSAMLAVGECCLLYTDGVTEAMNSAGAFFGEERLRQCLAAREADTPADVLARVMDAVASHRGAAEQSDDIALFCIQRTA